MKILMLTPYIPYPPASGGQVRSLNLLKYLSKNNEITLVCLYKNEDEKQYADALKSYCKGVYICKRPTKPWQWDVVLKAIFTPWPHLLVRNFSYEAKTVLKKLLKNNQFDVIHAETFYVMPHLPKIKTPVLLVEQTIEYKVYQHFVHSLPKYLIPFFYPELTKLKLWEIYYWKKATQIATVSEEDAQIIHTIVPSIQPAINPNGAGDDMFSTHLESKNRQKPVLLFIGNYSWLQNAEAAEYLISEIYPLLKTRLPEFHMIIAGQNAANKIKSKGNTDIEIVDIAAKDSQKVVDLYKQATLLIVPLFGPGGTRLKVLAAMAAGLPIISTDTGISGLSLEDNYHILLANTPQEFVSKIQLALSDDKLYEKLRKNAYQFAKDNYSYQAIAKKLEGIYKSIAHRHENRN